jgi:hypothetical protein
MKIISLEEHYRLPAIEESAKPEDPYMLMKEALTKSGHADKEKIAHLNAERLLVKRAITPTPRATSSIKGADIHEK